MNKVGKSKKVILILYLTAIHLVLGLLIYDKFFSPKADENANLNQVIPLQTPLQLPFEESNFSKNSAPVNQNQTTANNTPEPINTNANNTNTNRPSLVVPSNSDKLMIPVVGVKRENLTDTFSDARSENRVHNAIDIIAPQGTPVVSVEDGEIARFFDSDLGGITIYQFSKDKKFVYYYAHLQKRADNLQEKVFVPQGTVIGYVGDTGNAGAGNYHLHFSISIPADMKRYWEGENINPFPILKEGIEAQIR